MFLEKFTKNSPVQIHHILYFALLVIILPKSGFYFDMIDIGGWSEYMMRHGLVNVYGSKTNYVPLSLYFLYIFGLFFDNPADIVPNFYLFKIFAMACDVVAILAITYSVKKYYNRRYIEYICLFNLAILYNSFFWGQQDGIRTVLIVLSLICLLQNRPILGVVLLFLSINAKLHSVVMIPIAGIMFLYHLNKNWRLLPQVLLLLVVLQIGILWPFIATHQLKTVLGVVTDSVGFFPSVSWSAYNLWYLLTKSNPAEINDTTIFIKYSYRSWGFILFFVSSGIALMPLLLSTWQRMKHQLELDKNYYELTFLTSGLITILFFFVNTQMHERYSHPALALFFGYGLLTRKYWLYALTSVAYLLNLEMIYGWFRYNIYMFDIKPEIVSLLYVVVILICFWDLGKKLRTVTGLPVRL
jgi:Gpi18-like mannosyltransferase